MNKITVSLFALVVVALGSGSTDSSLDTVKTSITPPSVSAQSLNQPKPDGTTVLSEYFDTYTNTNAKIDSAALQYIEKEGIDPKKIGNIPVPLNWFVDYCSIPADCQFGEKDKKFFVLTAGVFTIYGPSIDPESRKYTIELTVNMPDDSKFAESKIELGICKYGLISLNSPSTKIVETVKLSRGKSITIHMPVDFESNFYEFSPMIKITGEIIMGHMTVVKQPDPFIQGKSTLVEGTLQECSIIPDPQKSDYPNCRFTCHFAGNSIIEGVPCPQEMSFVVEGFQNYELLKTNTLKAGDKVRCLIVPFDSLSNEQKTTQQADDLNLFSLDSYYVIGISRVSEFTDVFKYPTSGIYFTGVNSNYTSLFERRVNPPIAEDMAKAQSSVINKDLASINSILRNYTPERKAELNAQFAEQWEAEKANDPPGYNRVTEWNRINGFVWRDVNGSFWVLPASYKLIKDDRLMPPDKVEAIVALRDFLEANGCQLIVYMVPPMYAISARVINKDFRDVPDFATAMIAKQLLENGVEAVYASPEIINNYNRYPWAFFFPVNNHPSDTTQDVLAEIIAKKLARYNFPANMNKELFSFEAFPHVYGDRAAYLFPSNCDIGDNKPGTAYCCRRVLYDGKKIDPNPRSPVLVIGNSYIETPMYSPDSFPTLLASKLHMGIMVSRADLGLMNAIIQRFFANPQNMLQGKKVVILGVGIDYLLSPGRFSNIREMDRQAIMLTGKKLIAALPIYGNEEKVAEKYSQLKGVNLFRISTAGKCKVACVNDINGWDHKKETILLIPTCLESTINAEYRINGQLKNIPQCHEELCWLNVITKIPAGVTSIDVEVIGKPGAMIAIRNIQIFQ